MPQSVDTGYRLPDPDEKLVRWEYPVTSGISLRGWRSQPSGKRVLHFMHGNGYNGLTYWPLLAPLLEHVDLFIHDTLGHGDSDSGERYWTWNRNAELAHEIWHYYSKEYGKVPVTGCGHSMGGVHTLLWAAAEPDALSHLVLLDPIIFSPSILLGGKLASLFGYKRFNPLVEKARNRRNHWQNREEALSSFRGRGMFRGWTEEALQSYVRYAMEPDDTGVLKLKCPPEIEALNFSSLPKKLWSSIRRVRQPVSVLYGEESYPFVRQSVARASRLNTRFQVTSHAGGHCFMQQYPQQTLEWMLDQPGLAD